MARLRDDFRAGEPVSQVPASWFNAVARFVNGLVPGRGINITRGADRVVVEATGDGDFAAEAPETPTSSTDISGKMTETHVAADTPPVTADDGAAAVWAASADGKGWIEDSIVATDRVNAAGSLHRLWFVRKHYSSDGRLLKVEPTGSSDYIRV